VRSSDILVRKSEGKRLYGRLRCRWEDNIETYLKETGSEGVDCIQLTQVTAQWQAAVNTVMNFSGSIQGKEFPDQEINYHFLTWL
jgi:hypothetical protein